MTIASVALLTQLLGNAELPVRCALFTYWAARPSSQAGASKPRNGPLSLLLLQRGAERRVGEEPVERRGRPGPRAERPSPPPSPGLAGPQPTWLRARPVPLSSVCSPTQSPGSSFLNLRSFFTLSFSQVTLSSPASAAPHRLAPHCLARRLQPGGPRAKTSGPWVPSSDSESAQLALFPQAERWLA